MSKIIVNNFPTQEIMDRARKNHDMVFAFIHKPDCVTDVATSKAFLSGWLEGLGLLADPRLALIIIPKDLDLETAKDAYLEMLNNISKERFKI